jgi:glutathione S-transferase
MAKGREGARPCPCHLIRNARRLPALAASLPYDDNEARAKFGASAGGPFLYGEFSAADGMYAPVVSRFYTYGIKVDALSQAYMDAMRAHPAYQAWVAEAAAEPWVLAQNETETVIEDLRAKPKT